MGSYTLKPVTHCLALPFLRVDTCVLSVYLAYDMKSFK